MQNRAAKQECDMHRDQRRSQTVSGGVACLAAVAVIASAGICGGHVAFAPVKPALSAPAGRSQRFARTLPALTRARPGPDTSPPTALWSKDGRPTRQALDAIQLLSHADAKGLVSGDYQPDLLDRTARRLELTAPATDNEVMQFDSLMSAEVTHLIHDLHSGRVDPRSLGFNLPGPHNGVDLNAQLLEVARAADVVSEVERVEPRYAGYVALERALQRYRALAADSALRPPHAPGHVIHPGDYYDDMRMLRRVLVGVGDLAADSATPTDSGDSDRFSRPTVAAVARFQHRHGLDADSILGFKTMAALQVPLGERARQIDLALERWRWLPDRPPARYIVINIPAFRLYAFEHDSTARTPVLAMDVIVGQSRGGHRTPVFAGAMREVVFRPYWDVPPRIAQSELIPLLRRHPEDFARDGYEVVRGDSEQASVLEPSAENLSRVASGELRLRQRPGPDNALGLVKFVFPNQYDVYLHGTPQAELFGRVRRDFSHGCIRVDNPPALAAFVLQDEAGWAAAAIDSAMQGERTIHVPVRPAVQVYVLYTTVVIDRVGVPTFYPDVYGHDRALEAALHLSPYEPLVRRQVGGVPTTPLALARLPHRRAAGG